MRVEPMLRMIAGAFVAASVLLGMVRASVLLLVHAFRRVEPVPVGVQRVVSDDDDPEEVGRAELVSRA